MPEISRRSIVLLGVLAIAGCTTGSQKQASGLPDPIWPELPPAPIPNSTPDRVRTGAPPANDKPRVAAAPATTPTGMETLRKGPVPFAYTRKSWAKGSPTVAQMDPMLPPKWITVHHEGWTVFTDTSEADTKARLEQVRNGHLGRNWGDIGYHFVVDRDGRVWEGRSLKYQGAHVRKSNENNIGVMCLGNFMQQQPSEAQIAGLKKTLTALKTYYRIPTSRVRTHSEWPGSHTECPGKNLQAKVAQLRRSDLG